MKTVYTGYSPRDAFKPFHDRTHRKAVLVVHRRAGKTVSAINDLIRGALRCARLAPRFAYIAPTYAQAKDVVWDYLKRYTAAIPGCRVSESELHVTLPGDRRIRLYGADNIDRLRGIYLDGAVVDEPADMDPQMWTSIIRPALSDREGWCAWIGTPKGRDAFYRLWVDACNDPECFTMRLPASQSGILPEAELASAKRDMAKDRGSYEREYECSFETPVNGSIYGDIITDIRTRGQIRDFQWERGSPVFSTWDLGWNDSTSIWLFQTVGRDIFWIWHLRAQAQTAAQMATHLASTGIPIAAHYLPHDAASSNAATGTCYRTELIKAGLMNVVVVPRPTSVWPGINAARNILQRSWFRTPATTAGLEALEAYHTKDTTNGSTISKEPVHDWSSHCSDAFRIACEALTLGMVKAPTNKLMMTPRFPDGSIVDIDSHRVKHQRWTQAIS